MKKVVVSLVVVAVFAAILLTLMNNKTKMAEKTKVSKINIVYSVNTVKAESKRLKEDLSLVGEVIANNDVQVLSETQGKVIAVYTKVGQTISKGAAIAKVDDELKVAQLKIAEANLEKTKKDLERGEALYSQKALPENQLDGLKFAFKNAEANLTIAKRMLNDTKITAPFGGTVVARHIDIGSTVGNQTPIANIVDISSLKVKMNVPESIVFKLKQGGKVNVVSDAIPGATFNGTVETISAKGDDKHTFPIEIRIQNTGKQQLKSGMYARVQFTSVPERDAILIPRAAVIGSIKDAKVFVVQDGIAKLKSVVIGAEANGNVEILANLNAGEQVIIDGLNNLKDGLKVNVLK
jgi:RND family efflux transporter MFP subunit